MDTKREDLERWLEAARQRLYAALKEVEEWQRAPNCKLTTQRLNKARINVQYAKIDIWLHEWQLQQTRKEQRRE